jgi:hypothetical protein
MSQEGHEPGYVDKAAKQKLVVMKGTEERALQSG